MALAPGNDPRAAAPEQDVRPTIATPSRGMPGWIFALLIGIAAILLFAVLNARRVAMTAPATREHSADINLASGAPPPLYIPPALPATPPVALTPTPTPTPPVSPKPTPTPVPPQLTVIQQVPPPAPAPSPKPAAKGANDTPLVIDNTVGAAPAAAGAAAADAANALAAPPEATRASMLRARSTTVSQGTLIPAVLESALDSTRPGPARALVNEDVRGWDGSRVLIPRGSRLFGEYRADVAAGQKRVQVLWTRLVRPDGASIALGSPAGDPLGRVGVAGKVNNHFWEKFGSAFLQTGLTIGTNLATRYAGGNSVIVTLPGSITTTAQPLTQTTQIQPTIRVPQGTSITVFVARDLDFTGVENRK